MPASRLAPLLALLVLGAPTLDAQGLSSLATAPGRTIQVSGDAEILVLPDEVVLRLGVETTDPDLALAVSRNMEIVEGIEAAAQRAGVPSDRIVTDQLGLEPQTTNVEVEGRRGAYIPTVYGYRVRRGITVTLRDLRAFDTLLSDAVAAGATYVHSVDFQTTDLRRHRDEARVLAVRAAREKAEALAGELGQTVGAPLSISERGQGWFSGYGAGWGGWGSRFSAGPSQNVSVSAGESGPAAPGRIAIRASVDVTFALGE